ncbi:hypothetical protein ACLB2K_059743 [Fragaria x ananassa]
MFAKHLGSIIEVYVDDMLVKSLKAEAHVGNLKTIFPILLEYGMRLNSEKCFFGITLSKLLGYIVSERGVKANPTKIKAVLDMQRLKRRRRLNLARKVNSAVVLHFKANTKAY